jgi:N6-adenosine-specific RNA methylase IME4
MEINIFDTNKKYNIIYADPPWRYKDRNCNGACEQHYETMKLEDICKLPIRNIAEKDCVLFLWTTYPMIKESLKLIEAWGFTYKSIGFQWIKTYPKSTNKFVFGLGRWTRGNTEPCLIATKGKPKRIDNSVSQLIVAPIGKHSQKPNEAREKIIKLIGGDLPKIELFAREKVDGWDCWGNEVNNGQ